LTAFGPPYKSRPNRSPSEIRSAPRRGMRKKSRKEIQADLIYILREPSSWDRLATLGAISSTFLDDRPTFFKLKICLLGISPITRRAQQPGSCGEEHGSDTREYPVTAELSSRTWTYRQSSGGAELKLSTTADASGVYYCLLIASKGAWARIEIDEQSVCALAKAIASIEKNRADAFVIQSS